MGNTASAPPKEDFQEASVVSVKKSYIAPSSPLASQSGNFSSQSSNRSYEKYFKATEQTERESRTKASRFEQTNASTLRVSTNEPTYPGLRSPNVSPILQRKSEKRGFDPSKFQEANNAPQSPIISPIAKYELISSSPPSISQYPRLSLSTSFSPAPPFQFPNSPTSMPPLSPRISPSSDPAPNPILNENDELLMNEILMHNH